MQVKNRERQRNGRYRIANEVDGSTGQQPTERNEP